MRRQRRAEDRRKQIERRNHEQQRRDKPDQRAAPTRRRKPVAHRPAIDMARRGIHNEGARVLQERLEGKAIVDMATARRLFTLICVMHWG